MYMITIDYLLMTDQKLNSELRYGLANTDIIMVTLSSHSTQYIRYWLIQAISNLICQLVFHHGIYPDCK